MSLKPWPLILLLSFFANLAAADTFVVTSNADSGPGTLREAILKAAANGTATTDYITFNLPDLSRAGRTIKLTDSLPYLTSNLVVDGSTQAGTTFGKSDAKVILTNAAPSFAGKIAGFRIYHSKNVEIYGIYFIQEGNVIWSPGLIELIYTDSITIGATGKGNYFVGPTAAVKTGQNHVGVWFWSFSKNFRFEGNIVGLSEDGEDMYGTTIGNGGIALRNPSNITIRNNYVAMPYEISIYFYADTLGSINTGFAKIEDNHFGCNYARTKALTSGSVMFQTSFYLTDSINIDVLNNTFNSTWGVYGGQNKVFLKIEEKKGFINVKGNKIGLLTQNNVLEFGLSGGIFIIECENGSIGGPNPADSNIITTVYGTGVGISASNNITITKNSIYCTRKGISVNNSPVIPDVDIFYYENDTVRGKATPNCKIEVFCNLKCLTGCNNAQYYTGYTYSDANGNWQFVGDLFGGVTATATTAAGKTGELASPRYLYNTTFTKEPTCGLNNGYIKGMQYIEGAHYFWIREPFNGTRDTVYNIEELTDLAAGYYTFVVDQGAGCDVRERIALFDRTPRINDAVAKITHPSCGANNGSVTQIGTSGYFDKLYWKNEQGNVVGNQLELRNAGPGKYKLIVLDTTYGCGDSTEYFELINQSGPTIQTGNVQVAPAKCGLANGSITNITFTNVTGTPVYRWVDSLNNVVGSSADLLNIPAGKYRLKFKDAGGCDTITTAFYTIQAVGLITIDTSQLAVTSSQCAYASGTITGINVTGADEFKWYNAAGQVVSQQLNPGFVYPGKYVLKVSNQYGCTKQTDSITVPVYPFFPILPSAGFRIDGRPGTCDSTNGYIRAINFPDPQLYTFRWVDSANPSVVLSTTLELTGFNSGTFYMYAKNANNCEQKVLTARLVGAPAPRMDETRAKINHDICGQNAGSITGIIMSTGFGVQPFRFRWTNENNTLIDTLPDIMNLPAGRYRLQAADRLGCTVSSKEYIISNNILQLPVPQYDDQLIPRNTGTILIIKNLTAGGWYQLYDAPVNGNMLAQSLTGQFETGVLSADKTYYVQYVAGTCSSGFTTVKIKVFDKTKITVPNAFSPNGDGINDVWLIKAEGLVQSLSVQVFNRYGQLVYKRSGLNGGWDGRKNGNDLPAGTYYWMLEGADQSGNPIRMNGSVTLLR
ncbi:MAG: gliding motility-associated C-terminal domain-containing protein [Chitinophagaceae bacterium]